MKKELRVKLNSELTVAYLKGELPELFVSSLEQQRAILNRNWLMFVLFLVLLLCGVYYYEKIQRAEPLVQSVQQSKYKYIRISENGQIDSLIDVKPTSDCKGYYISDRYDSIMPAGNYKLKSIR